MSDALTDLRLVNAVRRRSFVLPREHGAWGILLVPLSTGATIGLLRGGDAVPLVAFLLAAISLFCLRTPGEAVLGVSAQRIAGPLEWRLVMAAAFGYSAVAAIALAALLWGGSNPRLGNAGCDCRLVLRSRKRSYASSGGQLAWPHR